MVRYRESIGNGSRARSGSASLACLLGLWAVGGAVHASPAAVAPATPRPQPAALPLNFEANRGQAAAEVEFLAHGRYYGIALTDHGATLALGGGSGAPAGVVRLGLVGAAGAAKPRAEQPLPGRVNYFVGKDPALWHTDIPTFGKVRYPSVYPGVDLLYYGNQGHLEYDFVVAPHARPGAIGIKFDGASRIRAEADGALAVAVHGRSVRFERPLAYQMRGQRRVPVPAVYRIAGTEVRFELGAYDHRKALIIDPVLSYLSYLGGSDTDVVGVEYGGAIAAGASAEGTQSAALDTAGDLYVVGTTYSPDFPTHGGLTRSAKYQGESLPWVFVSKVSPDASTLLYSTYIGGSFHDYGMAIATDSSGSAYITGSTDSADFPATAGAFQTICGPTGNPGEVAGCATTANVGGNNFTSSAYVLKLDPTGDQIVYSSFLGTAGTVGVSIAVDAAGRAYVAGSSPHTECSGNPSWYCFPTTAGAVEADARSGDDQAYAFVSVFNPAGSALQYSTLFGDKVQIGTNPAVEHPYFDSYGTAVALDAQGDFYLAGYTKDGAMPTTAGAYQTATAPLDSNGNSVAVRGYVAKFSPVPASGATPASTLLYGTYLGGLGVPAASGGGQAVSDLVSGIAVDAAGDAYVVGWTTDNGFPVTSGAYQTTCSLSGADNCGNTSFIAKLNPSGSHLLAATYVGGASNNDGVFYSGPIVLDAGGDVYVAGQADSGLAQVNAIQAPPPSTCCGFAYAAKLDPSLSTLLFSSLLGTGTTSANGIAVDATSNIYLAGNVGASGTLTPTPGVYQPAFGGNTGTLNGNYGDGFVAKISNLLVATTTTLSVAPTTATTGMPVTFTAQVKPASGSAVPTGTVTFLSGTATLGSGTLNAAGQATFSSSSLAVGAYTVTAAYGGSSADGASTSGAAALSIAAPALATTTTLSVTPGSAATGAAVVFTATVKPASGTSVPSGTVTFNDKTTALGTATLTAGVASFTTTSLAVGTHSITAAYAGTAGDAPSTSAAAALTITAPVPSAPTALKATAGNAQITLTWTASTGATTYQVFEGGTSGGESKTPVLSGVTGTSATLTGLTNGTAYYFTVAAVDAGGTGSASAEASATPTAPVAAAPPASHGGGGGAMNPFGLLLLAGLCVVRLARGAAILRE